MVDFPATKRNLNACREWVLTRPLLLLVSTLACAR